MTTSSPESRKPEAQDDEWARRRSGNLRLGLILGAVVVALFLLSIWKYRPL